LRYKASLGRVKLAWWCSLCDPSYTGIGGRIHRWEDLSEAALAKTRDPSWKITEAKMGWCMAQAVGQLPSKHKSLSSNPTPTEVNE
jgi:hypothetical protein